MFRSQMREDGSTALTMHNYRCLEASLNTLRASSMPVGLDPSTQQPQRLNTTKLYNRMLCLCTIGIITTCWQRIQTCVIHAVANPGSRPLGQFVESLIATPAQQLTATVCEVCPCVRIASRKYCSWIVDRRYISTLRTCST